MHKKLDIKDLQKIYNLIGVMQGTISALQYQPTSAMAEYINEVKAEKLSEVEKMLGEIYETLTESPLEIEG